MTGTAMTLPVTGLTPEQQLHRLWAHEQEERQRYRRAAFHFLTLDLATSRLLAFLGMECEARLARIESLAGPRRLPPAAFGKIEHWPTATGIGDDPDAVARRHFTQEIAAAKYAQQFYEAMCESNGMLALQGILNEGFAQKRTEHLLLLEHLETLPLPASTPPTPTS